MIKSMPNSHRGPITEQMKSDNRSTRLLAIDFLHNKTCLGYINMHFCLVVHEILLYTKFYKLKILPVEC